MTVREAFSKAFMSVPEEASCHIMIDYLNENYRPGYISGGYSYSWFKEQRKWAHHLRKNSICDIADRPAESFIGFFGDDYDKVVLEVPK